MYSAPTIAKTYDFGFLFIVEKKTLPPGLTNEEQASITSDGSGTCSNISRQAITSKDSDSVLVKSSADIDR